MFTTKELEVFDLDKIEVGAIVEFSRGFSKKRGYVSYIDLHDMVISSIDGKSIINDVNKVTVTAQDAKAMDMNVVLRGIDYAKRSLMSIDYE